MRKCLALCLLRVRWQQCKFACNECRLELLTERALERAFPYNHNFECLAKVDSGQLVWPTDFTVDIVVQSLSVFKYLVAARAVFKGGGGFTGSNPPEILEKF
jgi:hypothetical protein